MIPIWTSTKNVDGGVNKHPLLLPHCPGFGMGWVGVPVIHFMLLCDSLNVVLVKNQMVIVIITFPILLQ